MNDSLRGRTLETETEPDEHEFVRIMDRWTGKRETIWRSFVRRYIVGMSKPIRRCGGKGRIVI